ncbi:MAG TPA: O-antigen polymerase [Thermoanaerobacterales bacterium]|nr:O-antigen polymerase [Thermoanaerobacterales bacterium]
MWEKSAVERSRFAGAIIKAGPFFAGAINYINRQIRGSLLFELTLGAEGLFIESPLMALSCFLLPALISSTVLKALFSSFTVKTLVLRLALMALLLAAAFVNVSLDKLLSGSIVGKIISLIIDEKETIIFNIGNVRADHAGKKKVRIMLPTVGIITGALYYMLPVSTFIKLFGLIFLFMALYLRPWWGLFMVAFMLPLTATTYSVAIIGLTFICIILNYDKIKTGIPHALLPAVFFVATAVLAAAFSMMRADSIKTLPLYAAYFMVFYSSAILFKNRIVLKTALLFQAVSALVVSVYGIYQYFFVKVPTAIAWIDVKQFPELATRVYATLENPNVLAEYLVLVIPVMLGFLWASGRLFQKIFYLAAIGAMTLCLVLTFSRGGWLGLLLALMVFAALKEPRLLILLLALALISPLLMPSVVLNRIASIGSLEDSSNAFRVTIWIAALRMIKDYWLTGIGLGLSVFSRVYRDYMIAGTPALHAHNLYLEMGIEMGIAGLLAFLWMMAAGLARALDGIRAKNRYSFILAGVAGALGGHLLHGLFDYVWFSPRIVMAFWLVFGMMSALSSMADEKALNEET